MTSIPWAKEFPGTITICDPTGIVLEMNDRAAKAYAKNGGQSLVGKSLLGCHSPLSRAKLQEMLATEKVNVYTVEKKGVKKLIYQAPWYENGEYRGFVEIALPLPDPLPHIVRE